jgi:hypothetical protein
MHARTLGFATVTVGLLLACSSSSTTDSGDGGASSSSSGSTSSTSSSSSSSSGGTKPPASTTAAPVVIDAACPAFTACPGTPSGTYDYTGGCLGNVVEDLKTQCPSLDTSTVKVDVKGTLYFVGAALERNATVTLSGTLTVPSACSFGQCSVVQGQLVNAGLTATCTGTSDCACALAKTETSATATTFTVSGSTVTTGDGETYSICEQAGILTYEGKTAKAEDGTWTLKKR